MLRPKVESRRVIVCGRLHLDPALSVAVWFGVRLGPLIVKIEFDVEISGFTDHAIVGVHRRNPR